MALDDTSEAHSVCSDNRRNASLEHAHDLKHARGDNGYHEALG